MNGKKRYPPALRGVSAPDLPAVPSSPIVSLEIERKAEGPPDEEKDCVETALNSRSVSRRKKNPFPSSGGHLAKSAAYKKGSFQNFAHDDVGGDKLPSPPGSLPELPLLRGKELRRTGNFRTPPSSSRLPLAKK